jgi:hypothetical protein
LQEYNFSKIWEGALALNFGEKDVVILQKGIFLGGKDTYK